MMWRFIDSFFPIPHRDANEKRESCLKKTERNFSPVITSMYIKSKGVDKSQHAMDQVAMMVQSMQEAFRQNLDFIPWMSAESAEAAKAKLEHMADLIGYPTFVLNDTWLNQGNFPVFYDDFEARARVSSRASMIRFSLFKKFLSVCPKCLKILKVFLFVPLDDFNEKRKTIVFKRAKNSKYARAYR